MIAFAFHMWKLRIPEMEKNIGCGAGHTFAAGAWMIEGIVSWEFDVSVLSYMHIAFFFFKIFFSSSLRFGRDMVCLMYHQLVCM